MRSLRLGPALARGRSKPGPPGASATAPPPKSMARSGRGAGAAGAATPVSFEKSIDMPPKERAGPAPESSAEVSVAAPDGAAGDAGAGDWPFLLGACSLGSMLTASGLVPDDCCLLIDASLPRPHTPGEYPAEAGDATVTHRAAAG